MAPRHQQDHQRPTEFGLFEERREEVGFEVVDPHHRHAPSHGQGLGLGHADQQRPDEPGTMSHGDAVDSATGVIRSGLLEGVGQDRGQQLDVGPAGQLGDHAAVAGVQVDLAGDHRRDDGGAVVDDRRGRFVTGGFDTEDPADRTRSIGDRRRGRGPSGSESAHGVRLARCRCCPGR